MHIFLSRSAAFPVSRGVLATSRAASLPRTEGSTAFKASLETFGEYLRVSGLLQCKVLKGDQGLRSEQGSTSFPSAAALCDDECESLANGCWVLEYRLLAKSFRGMLVVVRTEFEPSLAFERLCTGEE
jgi:hypothetical protein